jgi:hypothetical protein
MSRTAFVSGTLLTVMLGCSTPGVTPAGGGQAGGGGDNGSGGRGAGAGSGGTTQRDAGFGFMVTDAGTASPPSSTPETCATTAVAAMPVALDVFLVVDTSGSMNERFAGQSKWQMVRTALESFLGDRGSNGLGAGLQFFPRLRSCMVATDCGAGGGFFPPECVHPGRCVAPNVPLEDAEDCATQDDCFAGGGTCRPIGVCPSTGAVCQPVGQACAGGAASEVCTAIPAHCEDPLGLGDQAVCEARSYERPSIEIAGLPPNATPIKAALSRAFPAGGTPMAAALGGAYVYLRMYLTAHADRKAVVVLVTDGEPMGCSGAQDVAGPARMALAGSPSVSTYAIGVFGPEDTRGPGVLERLAMAGGSGKPIVLQPGANLGQSLLAALNQIRSAALPCAFAIPQMPTGAIDFGRVNFHLEGSGGAEDLPYVGSAAGCGTTAGWHYDVDPKTGATPTQVILCPAACQRVKADASAKVSLTFGCQTKVIQ